MAKSDNLNIQAEAFWTLANAITCATATESREIFMIENGEIVNVLLKNGVRMKEQRLVLNILDALLRLVESDSKFNLTGHDQSVTNYMIEIDAK